MTIKLCDNATEKSTYIVAVSFMDSDGVAVSPKLASWTLKDEDGNIINSRDAIDIPTPSSEESIVLTGDDLVLSDTSKPYRYLLIEAQYDSVTYGNDLFLREEAKFKINDLKSKS